MSTATIHWTAPDQTHLSNVTVTLGSVGFPGPQINSVAKTDESYEVTGAAGSKLHYEIRAYYIDAPSEWKVTIKTGDITFGDNLAPVMNLRAVFNNSCQLTRFPLKVLVEGVSGVGLPSPNGDHTCIWVPDEDEWQKAFVGADDINFLLGVSCLGGQYYRRLITTGSGGGPPIGGGTALLNVSVLLDSGGLGYNTTGTATVHL